jgi:hypothetical protein
MEGTTMAITWQRQKPNECWITALAMVTGKPLAELHAEFTEIAGKTFAEIWGTDALMFFATVRTMHERYQLTVAPGGTLKNTILDPPPGGTKRVNLTTKQLHGKGILIVDFLTGMAHAVAFEDGMILDPEIEGWMMLKPWKQYHHLDQNRFTWRIDRVA